MFATWSWVCGFTHTDTSEPILTPSPHRTVSRHWTASTSVSTASRCFQKSWPLAHLTDGPAFKRKAPGKSGHHWHESVGSLRKTVSVSPWVAPQGLKPGVPVPTHLVLPEAGSPPYCRTTRCPAARPRLAKSIIDSELSAASSLVRKQHWFRNKV